MAKKKNALKVAKAKRKTKNQPDLEEVMRKEQNEKKKNKAYEKFRTGDFNFVGKADVEKNEDLYEVIDVSGRGFYLFESGRGWKRNVPICSEIV